MLGGPPTASCRSRGLGVGLDGRDPRPALAYQNQSRPQTDAESVPIAVGRSIEALFHLRWILARGWLQPPWAWKSPLRRPQGHGGGRPPTEEHPRRRPDPRLGAGAHGFITYLHRRPCFGVCIVTK